MTRATRSGRHDRGAKRGGGERNDDGIAAATGAFESDSDTVSTVAEQPQRGMKQMGAARHRARDDGRGRGIRAGLGEGGL
jgi:hypothetical protein